MAPDNRTEELESLAELMPQEWLRAFRRKLLAWYRKHERDLPWRADRDPYKVWVSEIMLQQTQVETVRAYFERFMQAFPNVAALAAAEEQEVLRLWEGLGYYRRARGLHAAAKVIVQEHQAELPETVEALVKLPGIGRYTAGAIVSIAHGRPAPILEANTLRLHARLTAYQGDPTRSAGQRWLWGVAEHLLPKQDCSRFNQALMELGSLVCKPKGPDCEQCPVAPQCHAQQQGIVEQLAPTTKRIEITDLYEVAALVRNRAGKVLVRQCQEGERWAGLWDLPRYAPKVEGKAAREAELATEVERLTGIRCTAGEQLKQLRHAVTRYRITLACHHASYEGGRLKKNSRWVTPEELAALPLSVTGRKLAKLV